MTRPRIVPPRLTRKEKMRLWPIELFLHSPQLSKFNLGFLKVRPGTESEECQMVECNLVKLVRKQKTIIIYIEFHIAEPTRPVRWEMAAGWRQSREEELLWDLTIESFAALFVILTVQYSTVQYSTVQYSTVQYSQVSIVGVIRLSKEFKVVTTNWLNDFPPNCWINYILNKYQISILKYHSVTFKDSIRYSSKDFGSIKERFSFLIFHLDRLAGNATRRHHWIWRSIFCLFQNKIPRILINRETSRPVTLRWGIE